MSGRQGSGRILAIDFGTKRIGFALSDEDGWSAAPLSVWHRVSLEADLAEVRRLLDEHEVAELVVGLPYRMDGSAGSSAARAQQFIDAVRGVVGDVPLHTPDETLTTYEAEERMHQLGLSPVQAKAQVDAYAALVILEEFLRARGTWVDAGVPESEGSPFTARRSGRGRRR